MRTPFVTLPVALLMIGGLNGQITAPVAAASVLTGPAVLDDWGNRFTTLGASLPENAQRTQIRTTIAQLAMFDAVNAVFGGPYRHFASTPVSVLGASPEAAAIRAAYIVALHEFPTKTAVIQSAYDASIAGLSASHDAIASGVVVGEAAAWAVLAYRADDHRNDPELEGYTSGIGPGVWIPTPPAFGDPQGAFLQFVTPFGFEDPSRFRPKAPPALESRSYARDYNEIKDLGRATETSRTPAQSATALFWSPPATALWTAHIRSLASSMDLLTAARFEGIGIAAVTNAVIACWDAKYAYMFWRPVTAIGAGDIDGNAKTEPDPTWTPFIVTPSHPEYPSAHITVGASALAFYTVWFGTTQLPVTFKGNGGAVRQYADFKEIRTEEGDARVWGGMHFRNSVEVGASVGSKVGKFTARHLLKPSDD